MQTINQSSSSLNLQAIARLDMQWAIECLAGIETDQAAEIILHQLRYEITNLPSDTRQQSYAWLVTHGCGRLYDLPWRPAAISH